MRNSSPKMITVCIVLFGCLVSPGKYAFSGKNDVNKRQHIPNEAMNKITRMRLEALTLERKVGDEINNYTGGITNFSDQFNGLGGDCNMSIGNNTGGSYLNDSQTIIIDGPIINYCK